MKSLNMKLYCSRISEQFLISILTEILEIFSFNISGFHADMGPEYINHQVAKLLQWYEKLLVIAT